MPTTEEIYALLEARRAELGLSQAELGRLAFDRADSSAIQNLRRGSSPTFEKLSALAEALGLELYLGAPRETGAVGHTALAGDEFAQIPVHAASLAAGAGCLNHAEDVVEYLAFRHSWLKQIGVAVSSAVLARANGDSMEPTIHSGDLVLIDTSRRSIQSRGVERKKKRPPIYAFVEDGLAFVKRIERVDENFYALISDNPDHSVKFLSEASVSELSVIGKVVWWGHTNRE